MSDSDNHDPLDRTDSQETITGAAETIRWRTPIITHFPVRLEQCIVIVC